jgi:hypothetical protein
MIKHLLFCVLVLLCTHINAQSFEGIIETHQTTGDGVEYDLIWYIKGDKIAYELKSNNQRMRFVPQRASNSMLMVTGENKTRIPVSDIGSPADFSMEGATLSGKGRGTCEHFEAVEQWQLSTNDVVAMVEVTTDVAINLSEYKEFFKSHHGLCALAASGKAGFPLNSTIKDKNGKVLCKTTLTKVTRTAVADAYFN